MIHIVTDSGAHFPTPHIAPNVIVVPNTLTIAGKSYREGVDLGTEEALRLIATQQTAPTITPPSVADYSEVLTRLARDTDGILVIVTSKALSGSWANARQAAEALSGHCPLMVIDSRMVSTGLALLIKLGIRTIERGESFDEVVRVVRGGVERVYAVYYSDSMDYLMQNHLMPPSHSILGMMLGLKPVIAIEEGEIIPIEKVRTRTQGLDRIVEFAAEFTDIEDVMIAQQRIGITEATRHLQERLAVEFPGRHFPHTIYGASLAALIGVDALGLVILEREGNNSDDEF